MGYRLGINRIEKVYYGTKLYGYHDNYKDFESYKYLVRLGIIEDEEYFSCFQDNTLLIRGRNLRKFIELYNYDLNTYSNYIKYEKDFFINDEDIKKLLNDLEEYSYYVIDWS